MPKHNFSYGLIYSNPMPLRYTCGLVMKVDAVPLPGSHGSSSDAGKGVGRSGAWLLDLLAKHGVTCDTAELIVRELERCSEMLMDGRALGGSGASLKLEAVVKFLRAVFRAKVTRSPPTN